ncbi:MAG: hypothetical protein HYU03_01235 [Thaumarchaeota archaeon]|nr:hypothetical protein [Nitrososphaerota archaeon]
MNTFRPEPSEELSFFLGAWLGDGWADEADGGKRLLLKVRSREFAEEFARCATRILNKAKTYKIREISEETRRWYLVRVTSMLLYDFVKQPVPKLKPFILPCSASFLRGFFTAEGCPCVSIENTNRPFLDAGLVVANSDYRLLEFARDLLSNLRFHPGRIRLNMLEGTRTNLAVARSSGWLLSLSRIEDGHRFANVVGFADSEKQLKLTAAISLIKEHGSVEAAVQWREHYGKVGKKWVKKESSLTSSK